MLFGLPLEYKLMLKLYCLKQATIARHKHSLIRLVEINEELAIKLKSWGLN
jgi:hypothetical protein